MIDPPHNPYCRPNEFFIFSIHVFMNFHVNIDISLYFQCYRTERAKAKERERERESEGERERIIFNIIH